MKTKTCWRLALFAAAAFAWGHTWAASVQPTTHAGNFTSCSAIDADPPLVGTSTQSAPVNGQPYAFGNGQSITFTYIPDGQNQFIGFSSTVPMDYIIVKGGDSYNIFHYDPAVASDVQLFAPNNGSGDPAGVSHVVFCTSPKPTGAKTADASWTRRTDWEIGKAATPTDITMFDGDTHDVVYAVSAIPTTKGTYRVEGTITVNDTFQAGWTVQAVADTMKFDNSATTFSLAWDGPGGNADTMTCINPAGAVPILSCSYAFELSTDDHPFLSSATSGVNAAGIQAILGAETYTFPVAANFAVPANPSASYGDTFSVNDSMLPANPDHVFTLADHAPWTYDTTFACNGDNGDHPNTATGIWATGPGSTDSDSASVTVSVHCKTVSISKTASTSFARTYGWTPEKKIVVSKADARVIGYAGCDAMPIASGDYAGSYLCDDAELRLNPGDTYDTVYKLSADQTIDDDSAFAVSGNIDVSWPAGLTPDFNPAVPSDTLTFTDQANGTQAVTPTCDAQGATSLHCTYSAALPRDFVPGYNVASMTRVKKCYSANGTPTDCGTVTYTSNQAALVYGAPSAETNKCIALSDLFNGIAGQNGGFSFEWQIHDNLCADLSLFVTGDVDPTPNVKLLDILANHLLPNTGKCEFIVPNLLRIGGGLEDLVTVSVDVPALCGSGGGCTYTQGYWKTHVNYAAKPQFAKKRDAAWDLIDGAGVLNENAIFYLSGKSYIAVMWTPPAGNAYYVLAHQYIAAKLNVLDGANAAVIATQLAQAEALFAAHAPNAAYWKQNKTSVATLAELLAAYNEGRSGPPHCSISPATLKAAN